MTDQEWLESQLVDTDVYFWQERYRYSDMNLYDDDAIQTIYMALGGARRFLREELIDAVNRLPEGYLKGTVEVEVLA